MKLETRFNVGDKVVTIRDAKAVHFEIYSVKIDLENTGGVSVWY